MRAVHRTLVSPNLGLQLQSTTAEPHHFPHSPFPHRYSPHPTSPTCCTPFHPHPLQRQALRVLLS